MSEQIWFHVWFENIDWSARPVHIWQWDPNLVIAVPVDVLGHYSDVTCVSWHLKSLTTRLFVQHHVQAENKEIIINCSYYQPFVRGNHQGLMDSGFPPQRATIAEGVFMSWHPNDMTMPHYQQAQCWHVFFCISLNITDFWIWHVFSFPWSDKIIQNGR